MIGPFSIPGAGGMHRLIFLLPNLSSPFTTTSRACIEGILVWLNNTDLLTAGYRRPRSLGSVKQLCCIRFSCWCFRFSCQPREPWATKKTQRRRIFAVTRGPISDFQPVRYKQGVTLRSSRCRQASFNVFLTYPCWLKSTFSLL